MTSYNEYESFDFEPLFYTPFSITRENYDFYERYDKEIEQNNQLNSDELSNFNVATIQVKDSEIKNYFTLQNDSNKTNENIPSKNNENNSNSKKETNIRTNKNDSNIVNDTQNEKQKEKEKENKDILNNSNALGNKRRRTEKKSNSTKEKKHTKFSSDNLNKKLKYLMIKYIMKFINEKNESSKNKRRYDGKLLTMKNSQIDKTTIDFNKKFLNKTLKDILSEDISARNTTCQKDHNRNLINSLINHEDENKKEFFTGVFDYTFKNCLEHFRGTAEYFYLNGLTTFDDIKDKFEDDKEYLDALKNYLDNYEENVSGKYKRKS